MLFLPLALPMASHLVFINHFKYTLYQNIFRHSLVHVVFVVVRMCVSTESDADSNCQDTDGFTDKYGSPCSGWVGYDCFDSDTTEMWYHQCAYTACIGALSV